MMPAAFVVFIFPFSLYMNNHIDRLSMIMPQLCKNCKHFHQILKKYGDGTFLGSGKTKNNHTLMVGADDHTGSSRQRKSIAPIGIHRITANIFFRFSKFLLAYTSTHWENNGGGVGHLHD